MQFSTILVFYYPLVLVSRAATTPEAECPSLDADKLARLQSFVVKEDVHNQLTGSLQELWGSKVLHDEDPDTCIKTSKQPVNDKDFSQDVRGKWFGGEQTRNSTLERLENGVYLEVLHNVPNVPRFVLAKVYVLYAKNNVFAYFWCLMYSPPADSKEAKLPSLSGVAVRPQDFSGTLEPSVQAAVDEVVLKVQENKDLLGEIVRYTASC